MVKGHKMYMTGEKDLRVDESIDVLFFIGCAAPRGSTIKNLIRQIMKFDEQRPGAGSSSIYIPFGIFDLIWHVKLPKLSIAVEIGSMLSTIPAIINLLVQPLHQVIEAGIDDELKKDDRCIIGITSILPMIDLGEGRKNVAIDEILSHLIDENHNDGTLAGCKLYLAEDLYPIRFINRFECLEHLNEFVSKVRENPMVKDTSTIVGLDGRCIDPGYASRLRKEPIHYHVMLKPESSSLVDRRLFSRYERIGEKRGSERNGSLALERKGYFNQFGYWDNLISFKADNLAIGALHVLENLNRAAYRSMTLPLREPNRHEFNEKKNETVFKKPSDTRIKSMKITESQESGRHEETLRSLNAYQQLVRFLKTSWSTHSKTFNLPPFADALNNLEEDILLTKIKLRRCSELNDETAVNTMIPRILERIQERYFNFIAAYHEYIESIQASSSLEPFVHASTILSSDALPLAYYHLMRDYTSDEWDGIVYTYRGQDFNVSLDALCVPHHLRFGPSFAVVSHESCHYILLKSERILYLLYFDEQDAGERTLKITHETRTARKLKRQKELQFHKAFLGKFKTIDENMRTKRFAGLTSLMERKMTFETELGLEPTNFRKLIPIRRRACRDRSRVLYEAYTDILAGLLGGPHFYLDLFNYIPPTLGNSFNPAVRRKLGEIAIEKLYPDWHEEMERMREYRDRFPDALIKEDESKFKEYYQWQDEEMIDFFEDRLSSEKKILIRALQNASYVPFEDSFSTRNDPSRVIMKVSNRLGDGVLDPSIRPRHLAAAHSLLEEKAKTRAFGPTCLSLMYNRHGREGEFTGN